LSAKSGVAAIADEVIGDVQKEAEALIAEAQNEAKETLRVAKEQADKTYNAILSEATHKSETEKRKIASVTEVELRNQLLQVKENIVDEAFTKATEALRAFVETEEYPVYLLKLLGKIAERMDQPVLVVEVNARDKVTLTPDALKRAGEKAKTTLKLSEQAPSVLGGCRVQTEDGKIVYDATLDNRLEELKPELRAQIARSLFGEVSQ
jgi:V/A-type H+-transporting ATPase subunit E